MTTVCVAIIAGTITGFTVWYISLVLRRKISPTVSTWIIFAASTLLSITTYLLSEKNSLQAGILNATDAISSTTILSIVVLWSGSQSLEFKPFEKWYLGAAGMIVLYGIITGDAWNSNLLTQVLISVGYFPTLHTMVSEKRNTEMIPVWCCFLLVAPAAFYLAWVDNNTLAMVYAARGLFCIIAILSVMLYYQRFPGGRTYKT